MSIVTNDFVFIHVPKTGGTSIENVIGGTGHQSISDIYNDGGDEFGNRLPEGDAIPVVAFVRNPYDRIVSAYHFLKQIDYEVELPESFDEFVRRIDEFIGHEDLPHLLTQSSLLTFNGRMVCNNLYYFENYEYEVKHFFKSFNINANVRHVHKSNHLHWTKYYRDPSLSEIIYSRYKEDFDNFKYGR